jgi:DinB superfamily
MSDTKNLPINISLTILHAVHARWHEILKNMSREELDRTLFHPQHKKEMTLWYLLGMYAWHSKHHVAHVTGLRGRMKW